MTLEQLNQDFGLPNQLTVVAGKGGFPVMEITNAHAQAKILGLCGAGALISADGGAGRFNFVSENAYYQPGKATKGGIPICWPWFGPDPEGKGRASHGFVRNRMWNLLSTEALPTGETKVRLGMSPSEETKAIWPYDFELVAEIVVGAQLTVSLITQNTGTEAFEMTQALHTYFTIGDVNQVQVLGLEDAKYLDKVDAGVEKTQSGAIAITSETDRVYMNVKPEAVIDDPALGRRIRISTSGSQTSIVWNPWTEIAVKMADLVDSDYLKFICVETANAANDVIEVAPGATYQLQAVYAIEQA